MFFDEDLGRKEPVQKKTVKSANYHFFKCTCTYSTVLWRLFHGSGFFADPVEDSRKK